MPHVRIIIRRGDGSEQDLTLAVPQGTERSLQDLAIDKHLKIGGACGGLGLCTTCRVKVLSGGDKLPRLTRAEKDFRERQLLEPDERLACQFSPDADLTCSIEK